MSSPRLAYSNGAAVKSQFTARTILKGVSNRQLIGLAAVGGAVAMTTVFAGLLVIRWALGDN